LTIWCLTSKTLNKINGFLATRLFHPVGDCRLKMDGITLKTRTETRTIGLNWGNGSFDRLAWCLAF
jgi:hypothetical protein